MRFSALTVIRITKKPENGTNTRILRQQNNWKILDFPIGEHQPMWANAMFCVNSPRVFYKVNATCFAVLFSRKSDYEWIFFFWYQHPIYHLLGLLQRTVWFINGVSPILHQRLQLLFMSTANLRIVTFLTLQSKLKPSCAKSMKFQTVWSLVRNTSIDLFALNFKVFICPSPE